MHDLTQDQLARKRARDLLVRRREIFALPPEVALNAILDSDQPVPLVHSMAPQDLHLLIRDIGPDDAVVLLNLASNGQWDYLLDLEVWRQDRLEGGELMQWLERLREADPRRLGAYLFENQPELLTLYLFRNIVVYFREHDQEASEFPPDAFTLDGQFYIRIPEMDELDPELDAARRQNIQWLIEDLAGRDYFTYQKLVLETATVLPAEMEEEAFRLRNVRLAERGVLPFHEAVGVYQPLSRRQIRNLARKVDGGAIRPETSRGIPILPRDLLPSEQLLARALEHITAADQLDRIHEELAALGNAVIVADQQRLNGREDLKAIMAKVVNGIAMGLEHLAGHLPAPPEAARWLKRVPLADLFRVGNGLGLAVHERVRQWVFRSWFHRQGLPLSFWDETGMGVLGGLLLKRPRFYDPALGDEVYRGFESVAEVTTAEKILLRLMAVDDLLGDMDIDLQGHPGEGEHLTCYNLLLTLWAQRIGGKADETGLAPLSPDQLGDLLAWLFETPGAGQPLAPAAREHFRAWLGERSGWSPAELHERLEDVVTFLFEELAQELGAVRPSGIDPRYIRLFLLESPAA